VITATIVVHSVHQNVGTANQIWASARLTLITNIEEALR